MAKTAKVLNDELRAMYFNAFRNMAEANGEETLVVSSNEMAIPVVDSEGNEKWIVVTIKVPSGTRDGDAYDGYAMAEDYRMKQTLKADKAKERAAKAERDKAKRAAKAKEKEEA